MSEKYSFRLVFIAACLGMVLFGIAIISLGSTLPSIIEKFGLDKIQAGSLASILPAGILLGSLIFGPIVDRHSYRNLLIIFTILIILGFEGAAFSTGLFTLQISFFLIGFGGGALNGGTNALVADISEKRPDKRSSNLSLLGVFYGIGALGIPLLIAVLSTAWPFERILKYTGFILLIPLFYFAIISYPAAKQKQGVTLSDGMAMIKDKYLVVLGLFLFFESALEGIISNWSTTFLQKENGINSSDALLALSVYILSLTVSRLILTSILRRIRPLAVLFYSLGIIFTGVFLLFLSHSWFLFIASFILLGMGTAAGFPVILGYVGDMYTNLRGTAFSFVFFIALIGNTLMNYFMGIIAEKFGINTYPIVLLFCACFLLLIGIFMLPKIVVKNK